MSKMMTLMKAQMNNLIPINEIKERGSKKQTSIVICTQNPGHIIKLS